MTPPTTKDDVLGDYLGRIGVRPLAPAIVPFDPGLAPTVLESHLSQSAHLMLSLKISMACWMIADEQATRKKVAAAREAGVRPVTGGGPYEVAVAQGQLQAYLELCAGIGFHGIEAGAGFTDPDASPEHTVAAAAQEGLELEYELGKKHGGTFDRDTLGELVQEGERWLQAGAARLIVEGRESGAGVGIFDAEGRVNESLADALVDRFGLGLLVFEAPTKRAQFALLDHYGPSVQLSNVPLDEVLRVEIYRRGLHSDAFANELLRPARPRIQRDPL